MDSFLKIPWMNEQMSTYSLDKDLMSAYAMDIKTTTHVCKCPLINILMSAYSLDKCTHVCIACG